MDTEVLFKKIKDNLFSLMIVGFCAFFAWNTYKAKNANLEQLRGDSATETKKNSVLSDINLLEKQFADIKAKVNIKETRDVINLIGTIAKESGVKMTNFRPGDERKSSVYRVYPVELTITASDYHRMAKFINRLERAPEVYTVERFEISFPGEGSMTARLSVSTLLIN